MTDTDRHAVGSVQSCLDSDMQRGSKLWCTLSCFDKQNVANCALRDVMHRLCQDALCFKTVMRLHGTGDCKFIEARKESAAFLETFFLQLAIAVQICCFRFHKNLK